MADINNQYNSLDATPEVIDINQTLDGIQTETTSAEHSNYAYQYLKDPNVTKKQTALWIALAVAMLVLFSGTCFGIYQLIKSNNNSDPASTAVQQSVSIPLEEIGNKSRVSLSQPSRLDIMGTVNVNGTLRLSQEDRPVNPQVGTIYLDKKDQKIYYYNGSSYKEFASDSQTLAGANYVQLQGINTATAQSGSLAVNGAVSAGQFNGSGAGLGNLNASSINTGTISNVYLPNQGTLNISAGRGLVGGGNVSLGGSVVINTVYGSTANTSVQGDTTLICPSGTGNLTGGGNVVTLGNGGSCGSLSITDSPTFNGNVTVNGDTFTNNGATLLSTTNLGDFPTGGPIGLSTSTVDVKTSFEINQTTPGQTLTLPNPTNTSAGRIVYVFNIGSATFSLYGVAVTPNASQGYAFNGSIWAPTNIDVNGGGGGGGFTNLTLAGTSGTPQTITDTGTITIAAGTNINTTAGATGTVTVATVNNPSFSGLVTASNGLTVSAGNLLVSGGTINTATISGGTLSGGTVSGGSLSATTVNGVNTADVVVTTGNYADPSWISSLAKSKVGLSNVENTALSTWLGSTNIASVGTITTGTWTGSVIGDAYINDALTISSGGSVDWVAMNNYPSACAAGSAITALGDTPTCTTFAAGSGSGNYIQNQNAGAQTTSNFWLSGTGRADTSFTTPLLDTPTAVALNVGTTNATQINLNKATQVTGNLTQLTGAVSLSANAASSLTTSAGALTLTSATAATWSTTAGNLTLQSGSGTLSFGSTTALTATGALGITSGGANALTLDAGGAATLRVGTTNANAVSISRTGITTTVNGNLTVAETANLNGNTTLGNATTDRLTVTSQLLGQDALVFQGATDNGFTSTLRVTDPTANNILTLPNETGTICTTGSVCAGYASATGVVLLAPASAQTDASTNSSIFINKTGASGNILQLQKGGVDALTLSNGGSLSVRPTANTVSALNVVNVAGTTTFEVNSNNGTDNIFLGKGAPAVAVTGNTNVGLGIDVLSSLSSGSENVGLGSGALQGTSSGAGNTAIGIGAAAVQNGSNNVAIGKYALAGNAPAVSNTGSGNVAIGFNSLNNISTGSNNVGIGANAFANTTTVDSNTGVGVNAGLNNLTGTGNVALGRDALYRNETGSYNVAIGNNAGGYSATAYSFSNNVLVGRETGYSLQNNANNNILLGYRAGDAITTGTTNLLLGYDIDAQSATGSNQLSIGNLIFGQGGFGTGTTVGTGTIGIGTATTLTAKLTVDNGAAAIPIFVARDNGTDVLTLSDGGTSLTFGTGADRTINVATQTTAATAGNNLTVSAATGNTTGAGGQLILQSGQGGATGAGGATTLRGGAGGATSGAGGALALVGGNATTSGAGGAITITGGAGVGTNQAGGDITLSPGVRTGSGTLGSVIIKPQASNDSTTLFQIQKANGDSMLTADTTNGALIVGNDPGLTGAKARLHFGDYGSGSNVWIGEQSTTDTDIMQLQGKDGIYLTVSGSPTNVFTLNATGQALFQNQTNSATAFQIQKANGDSMLTADTTNGALIVGSDPGLTGAKARLHFGDYGSGSNIWIGEQSTTDTDIMQLQGKNGIYFTVSDAPTNVFTLSASGRAVFQNQADSTTAFGIKNLAGNTLLNVDTTTARGFVSVALGNTASTNAVCSSLANTTAPAANTAYELRDCNAAPAADYAEMYPVTPGTDYGDIVAIGTEMVNTYDETDGNIDWNKVKGQITRLVKSSSSYQSNVIGIVSNNYGDFTSAGHNIKEQDNPMPVALNGRVPVKISASSSSIQPGDYITTSPDTGKAIKAEGAGTVIGKALEAWDPLSGKATIMVYVEQGYYPGPPLSTVLQGASLDVTGSATINGNTSIGGSLNVSGNTTLTNLTVNGNATFTGNLTVENISVKNITINGHIITAGNAPTATVGTAAGVEDTNNNIPAPQITIDGNDTAGTVTVVAGANTTSGNFAEVNFNSPFSKVPKVMLNAGDEQTSNLKFYRSAETGKFYIKLSTPPTAGTTYSFDYFIVQ